MSPKTLYRVIFWGLILPIFAFPVAGIELIPAIGYAMIAFASWKLGSFLPQFRLVAVSSTILMLITLPTPYLSDTFQISGGSAIAALLFQCLLGWRLLGCVARDCDSHGHIDIAARARWMRFAYVAILGGVPLALAILRLDSLTDGSSALIWISIATTLTAYVLLVWTVQSAKIRLFP